MKLCLTLLLAAASLTFACRPAAAAEPTAWNSDYADAVRTAEVLGKMLLVQFVDPAKAVGETAFDAQALADPKVAERLSRFVKVRVPLDATISIDGQRVTLLQHPAFAEMLNRPGLAIIDYASSGTPLYGRVVSVFPFKTAQGMTARELQVVLDLPRGSLTQRTMIYAVRIHPESPASTRGEFNPVLAEEAQSHADYQAAIRVQGHHRWGHRFNRILGRLRGAGDAREVVAESWPGQTLVDACVECVHSWRQSSGHWQAVRSGHASFGYDIKRGANGIWYATGIFADRNIGG